MPDATLERFMSKVVWNGDEDECWVWAASTSPGGYGQFNAGSRNAKAHRFAYEHFIGPVPQGLELDHVCHSEDLSCKGGKNCIHRRCVNPAHLEPVTRKTNIARGRLTGRTHCPAGHAYTEANRLTDGRCRECDRLCHKRYYELHRDEIRARRRAAYQGPGHYSKLTADDVREIRVLLAEGVLQREICARYGISQGSVTGIKTRRTWKEVL